jgi:glycosyltransferase involved in cell wall biosynthesis
VPLYPRSTDPPSASSPLRIASIYRRPALEQIPETDAAVIWWKRIAEGLAARGHSVDLVAGAEGGSRVLGSNLRTIPFPEAAWPTYDAILTFFDRGFDNLIQAGGHRHPFIISSLGSVVGSTDETPGIYFFGERRQQLYEIQQQIAERSRLVVVLTESSRELWIREHGRAEDVFVIPQGVDRCVPPPMQTPYGAFPEKIAVFIGTVYDRWQKEMNLLWQQRLNKLGAALRRQGIRLCLIGVGDTDLLDPAAVTYLGPIPNQNIWDYHYFASAGVILAHGPVQHNESTKLYYYLRAGLPVVSEAPVPNNQVLEEAGLGFLVPFGDEQKLADRIAEAATFPWDRTRAMTYMIEHHGWDARVTEYERLLGLGQAIGSAIR